MELMGAPHSLLDDEEETQPVLGFPVFQENQLLVEWLVVMQNQWCYAGMTGTRVGFNYSIMPFFAETFGLPVNSEVLSGMMEMEMAILAVFNDKA